jgi:hypothetical protein
MPEHVHLLVTEPTNELPARAFAGNEAVRRTPVANVFTEKKRLEKRSDLVLILKWIGKRLRARFQ